MPETAPLIVLAYIGPDVLIPLASFAAAILGAIMIGWRWFAGAFSSVVRFVLRRPAPEPAAAEPDETEGQVASVTAETTPTESAAAGDGTPQPARS